jgi:hypothetical protein
MTSLPTHLSIGDDISIELLQENKKFLGLGSVCSGKQILRASRRPMFVEIRNPSGIELLNYSLIECAQTPEEVRLKFAMERREGGNMEWMVHEVRSRYNTADWTAQPRRAEDTILELELRPVSREIGGRKYAGFSYRYHYDSDRIPIYKILDRGTWEIGGKAIANEFWMRNCFVPAILRIDSADQFYSSEWYIPTCANPTALQFQPLQTELQGFTFTAAKAGVLVIWPSEVAHIRSLFEKPPGEELMVHFHEHCGDLGYKFATAPVEVLWCPGERDRVGLANDYAAVGELVHETLHAQVGMRRERVTTYGQIEEWGPADLERYRCAGLTKLLQAEMKTVFLSNHFENNMNTWGVSNMCCTLDYKVSESVGEDKLRAFCEDARSGGATVEMWGNTSISTLTPILNNRNGSSDRIRFLPKGNSIMDEIDEKTAFVRNPSNAIESDHYAPVFAVLNLRDASVRKYWLSRWKLAHDDVGLGGIFLDSSFNLSSDKFHYIQNAQSELAGATADQGHLLGNMRPAKEPEQAILSQYHAHLSLMAEMQKMGFVYCNEDLGVFGIHRHGPNLPARLDTLFLWSDCIAGFDPFVIREAGHEPDDIFFRGLAYRMMWGLHWDIKRDVLSFHHEGLRREEDAPKPWHYDLWRIYNRVEDLMRDRTILEGESGVLFRSGEKKVLWAFADLVLTLDRSASVLDLTNGERVDAETVKALRHHIYLIDPGGMIRA